MGASKKWEDRHQRQDQGKNRQNFEDRIAMTPSESPVMAEGRGSGSGERFSATTNASQDVTDGMIQGKPGDNDSPAMDSSKRIIDMLGSISTKIQDAAKYLETSDAKRIGSNITGYVRRHPTQAAVLALTVGAWLNRNRLSRRGRPHA